MPEGVTTVGESAFFGCKSVETFYMASTIKVVDYGAFTFCNQDKNMTITSTAALPFNYGWEWHYMGTPTIKVPAAYIETYRANEIWNGSNNGKQNTIITIENIVAPEEETTTSFAKVDDDTDLGDAVVGDVYVTVGEDDGYDSSDGSIVLNSSMTDDEAEAIGGMAPGVTDLSNRFNGLVVMAPAGEGSVSVDCRTFGSRQVAVKIGDAEPQFFTKNEKGVVKVDYKVTADTYIYIYGVDATASASASARSRAMTRAAANENCVKLYAITVNPKPDGIAEVEKGNSSSPITGYFTLDGKRVNDVHAPGVYIVRRADGTSYKIVKR